MFSSSLITSLASPSPVPCPMQQRSVTRKGGIIGGIGVREIVERKGEYEGERGKQEGKGKEGE